MTSDRVLIELTRRDSPRLERINRLIIFGKPAVAQALLEAEADEEASRGPRTRYTRPV